MLVLPVALVAVLVPFSSATASGAGSGTISGSTWKDLNRDGVQQADEPVLTDQQLYLLDGAGNYLATTYSDASGRYEFSGLADGDYTAKFALSSWAALRGDWVPTTTGSIFPRVSLTLSGSATADFGWRPIVRSTELAAPISTFTGPNGLRIESFDDVVPAQDVYDAAMRGTVGSEAQHVKIRFDWSTSASTVASWQESSGGFSSFRAVCYDTWISWLTQGDVGVSHEHGHAWSLYHDVIVQQEDDLARYLRARELEGDARVNSSYAWNARELVAEDYRQLLGSPTAREAAQTNRELAPASEVPGLLEFLRDTFTTSPAPLPPPPPPPVTVVVPSVTPTPVTKSGTVSTSVSVDAKVTVEIRAASGALVRTLLSAAEEPAGGVSVKWDRKDANGRRVKPGTYVASVTASAGGASASASTPFSVS